MDPRAANNLNIFETIFGNLKSFRMEYEPQDTDNFVAPIPRAYVNVPYMLKSTDCGIVTLTVGKLITTGSPLVHSAYINKYVPYSLHTSIIKSEFKLDNSVYEILITFRLPSGTFNQLMMDAYQIAFDQQFTTILEDELTGQ